MMDSSRTTRFRGRITTFEEESSAFELPSHSYDSNKGHRRPKKEEPSPWALVAVILFILTVFGFVRYVDFKLPTPLTVADVQNNPNSFIEERAFNDLRILASVGPRVAGSYANDIATIDTLTRIMQEIARTKLDIYEIEYEVQKPVGSFHMSFQDGLTSSYSNILNFVVKVSPLHRVTNDTVLVNCHFDSVPGSPGASDDLAACAVMLESIRVLSRNPKTLRNSIVFLFNGAEENLLQGAHGFVKGRVAGSGEIGHRWTKHLQCFINLEGAGAGAREILFQTGPGNGWLVDAYTKVPYPWGSVVGEEIFQNGLIPSDTDFRIFRDYSRIPGLDMAFVKNGYVYHTKYDDVDHVTAGSLQHEGSNVLSLLTTLGNVDFGETDYNASKMVFFDVFGFFMISYSAHAAAVFNFVVGLLVLVIAWTEVDRKFKSMAWLVFSTILAWIAGISTSVLFGLLLNYFQIFSPYHSYPMSVFGIFGIPCLVAQVVVFSLTLKGCEDLTWMAGKTTLALCLILTTFFTRIVFSVTFNLLFGMIGLLTARILFKGVSPVVSVDGYKLRLGFYLIIGETFPLALSLYLVTGCLDTFVPIMARSGSETNPNLFMAVLTSFTLTVPTVTGLVPIFVFFKKTFLRLSAVVMLTLIVIMVFVVGRIPYTDKTPMRVHLIEVDRSVYEADLTTVKQRDAGFWLFNVDPNIPNFYEDLGEKIPEFKHENHVEIDAYSCDTLYCGLPFVFPVKKLIRRSHLIPKPISLPDSMTSRVRMEITQNDLLDNKIRRVTFSFVGPDHITINLSPGEHYEIDKWTLTNEVPNPMSVRWKGRPTYFVYHARGISFERFNVTIDFKKTAAPSNPSSSNPLVDINYSAFYIHGEEMKSQEMRTFINQFPPWTYVLGFTGVSHVYTVPE